MTSASRSAVLAIRFLAVVISAKAGSEAAPTCWWCYRLETSELTLEVLSPRILSLRHREEQLEAARDDAERQLQQRRVELPNTEEVKEYVADFRGVLGGGDVKGTFPERKALIRNFLGGIEVNGDEAVLTYTILMPNDGVTSESASVLDFVKSGPPDLTKSRTFTLRFKLTMLGAQPSIP